MQGGEIEGVFCLQRDGLCAVQVSISVGIQCAKCRARDNGTHENVKNVMAHMTLPHSKLSPCLSCPT